MVTDLHKHHKLFPVLALLYTYSLNMGAKQKNTSLFALQKRFAKTLSKY